jgi:hypothetical protein
MRNVPALATALLQRLGPADDSLVGDLVEEYAAGRTRAWYWRQVLCAIPAGFVRQIRSDPMRAVSGAATGWATLLVFFLFGDSIAEGVAGWFWGWDRQSAYRTGDWRAFAIAALGVSYTGFALSALAVARFRRRHAGPLLVGYAASMLVVLAASAALIDALSRFYGGVPVPHTLFYVVSVALPYHWRSGLLLAPLTILVVGAIACPRQRVVARLRA